MSLTVPDLGEPDAEPRLGAVGVGQLAERVYRHLVLAGEPCTASQVTQALRLSPRVGRDVLNGLVGQGLVTRAPTRPPRYVASPPEVGLGSLLSERGEELVRVRQFVSELQRRYREAALHGGADNIIEMVLGREPAVRSVLYHVHSAESGVDMLTKPPYVAENDVDHFLSVTEDRIRRGVRARSVYDSDVLDEQTTLVLVQRSLQQGEEARALGGLPMKLAIVDRRVGVVPLSNAEPELGAVVVHASPLLDALVALFDSIWTRAVPLAAHWAGRRPDQLDERAQQVLQLMSAGLKDDSIARALNMSRRTVQKHVTATMEVLGARTRFQAALLARERGWVGAPTAATPVTSAN